MGEKDFEWQRKSGPQRQNRVRGVWADGGEITLAVRAGKLQCREGTSHGKPRVRLLRREVEELVAEKRGNGYLIECRAKAELENG